MSVAVVSAYAVLIAIAFEACRQGLARVSRKSLLSRPATRRSHSPPSTNLAIPDGGYIATTLSAMEGFGGSCFPKDVTALKQLAGNSGYHFQLLNAVIASPVF